MKKTKTGQWDSMTKDPIRVIIETSLRSWHLSRGDLIPKRSQPYLSLDLRKSILGGGNTKCHKLEAEKNLVSSRNWEKSSVTQIVSKGKRDVVWGKRDKQRPNHTGRYRLGKRFKSYFKKVLGSHWKIPK